MKLEHRTFKVRLSVWSRCPKRVWWTPELQHAVMSDVLCRADAVE
jgi:hypothetical protein